MKAQTEVEVVTGACEIVRLVGEVIREAERIPSGHLYAALCGVLSLKAYKTTIRLLKDAKLVEEKNHELIWIG